MWIWDIIDQKVVASEEVKQRRTISGNSKDCLIKQEEEIKIGHGEQWPTGRDGKRFKQEQHQENEDEWWNYKFKICLGLITKKWRQLDYSSQLTEQTISITSQGITQEIWWSKLSDLWRGEKSHWRILS